MMPSENNKNQAKSKATVYTAKDKIVDLLREAGYDFFTASEIATETIREFKASGKKRQRYYLKNGVSFVIQKKEANKRRKTMTTYSHAEIRPTAHQPLATGPVFDGLPEGVNAADLDFQGATDLPDNTEWAIFTRDSGERMMVWRVES